MNIDLALKDLIPFGSALFGAVTGGFITYKITRAKERKEFKIKRLESIFELQKISIEMLNSFSDLKIKLDLYMLHPEEEAYKLDVIVNKMNKCMSELADSRVRFLGNALHVSKEVYDYVSEKYVKLMNLFMYVVTINRSMSNEIEIAYSKSNGEALDKVINEIGNLQRFLMDQEKKYVELYIK